MISPYSQPRMDGISRFAKKHGWSLVPADRIEDYEDLSCFDGILMALRDKPALVKSALRIVAGLVPAVDVTIERPDIRLPRVVSDHFAIGRKVAQHFVERGFEKFAWFSSGWSHVHELRFEGFKSALQDGARLERWHAKTIAAELAASPKPVAAFAYSEPDAARLVLACRAAGLSVPTDVSIIGVGNDPNLSETQAVSISSIDQKLSESAYAAAELLEKLMDMPVSCRKAAFDDEPVLMPPGEVVARDSSNTLAHSNPTVRAALVRIHEHISKPYGAQELAEELGVSRRSLDRLFADELHRSVGDEILRQRMLRVKRLLVDRSVPVKGIAAMCGFCNAAYLTNVFRRETGMSPREWRSHRATDSE